ncbi:uncharacterized protein LOC117891017 [Drosophila subobscura]|uniref:uncharacterized protein LOC117891017 n=1 Tax=Drosophila subobscura TaxID=7241 RepID=UPI00155A6FFC|nr:uncharacterized protein LOC117891017 [Drosophila subobscura]
MSLLQSLWGRLLAMSKPNQTVSVLCRTLTTEQKLKMRWMRLKQRKAFAMPCYMSLRRTEYKCPAKDPAPVCDGDPCDEEPLPRDLTDYRPSDKAKRKYQRNWSERYPEQQPFVPMKRIFPLRARRSRGTMNRPQTACQPELPESGRVKPDQLMDVQRIGAMPCCKMSAPHCRPVRNPPTCHLYLKPSCCHKRATKYPSFSECRKQRLLEPLPVRECAMKVSICDMWAYWRSKRRGW